MFDLSICGATCNEIAKLTASDGAAGDGFGYSVSLSGTRALVGVYSGNFRDSTYEFKDVGGEFRDLSQDGDKAQEARREPLTWAPDAVILWLARD